MRTVLRSVVPLLALLVLVPPSHAANDAPGWLGLRLAEATGESAGVIVRGVVEGSPADEEGLRAKDAILAVDGAAVSRPGELMARLRAMEPGSSVTLSVKRGAREFEVRTVLSARPEENLRMVRGWLGVEAIELPASLRAHYGAPDDSGILVSAVVDASPAYDAGIRVGDVIYEADAQPVTSIRDLSRLVSEAGVENVMDVVLARDGARIVVGPQIQRVPAN
jgi:S1-C subfamily serine protease